MTMLFHAAVAVVLALTSGAGSDRQSDRAGAAKPDCLVSDVQPTAKRAPTALPIDVRRAIFGELQQVLDRAKREALAAYPTADGSTVLGPGNVQKDTRLSAKRDNMQRSLELSYLPDVLKKRSLTCAAAREIRREGVASRWKS